MSAWAAYPAVFQAEQIYSTARVRTVNSARRRAFGYAARHWDASPRTGRQARKSILKQDTGKRNAIEGKFGEGKRKYGLGCIRARFV
ncbi:hypothetical protein BSK66_25030 [Paenibacillus odorifer]|nr:hypothetical protein BSK66_25030 [Paenibacillus odorifer]